MKKITNLLRNFSFGICILMLGTFSSQVKGQSSPKEENLSLAKAIQLAVNNHPLIKEAEDHVSVAKSRTEEGKSLFYPQAEVLLDYNYIAPQPYFQLPEVNKFYIAPRNNYNGNLAINYLIYDFNRRKEALKLLRSNEITEAEKVNLIRDLLAYQTAEVYYSILYLQESISVMDKQIEDLNEHFELARKLVETGSATGLDTLTTMVSVTALKNQKMSLQNQLEKSGVLLKSLMNFPDSINFKLSDKFEATNITEPLSSLLQKAYAQREEIILNKLYVNTADVQKNIAKKINFPVLNFHSSFGVKNGYPNDLNRPYGNFVLGLSAAIPVFDGFLRKSRIATAKWNIVTLQDQAAVIKQNIRTEVEQALLEYQNKQIQLKTAQEEIVQADAARKQAGALYQSGSITNTTLLDAQTSLVRARLKYTYQLYLLTLSDYKLLQATGEKIW